MSPNTLYTYRVRARDSALPPNRTAFSDNASATTWANMPAAPTLGSATLTTLNLDVNAGNNPAVTEFAVMCTGSFPTDLNWDGKYVTATGTASSSAVWQTEPAWGTVTAQGLEACTTYTFAVKARSSELVETALGASASLGTGGSGDMNSDGVVDGDDIQLYVDCLISGGSGCACANIDVPAFVGCLLEPGA